MSQRVFATICCLNIQFNVAIWRNKETQFSASLEYIWVAYQEPFGIIVLVKLYRRVISVYILNIHNSYLLKVLSDSQKDKKRKKCIVTNKTA